MSISPAVASPVVTKSRSDTQPTQDCAPDDGGRNVVAGSDRFAKCCAVDAPRHCNGRGVENCPAASRQIIRTPLLLINSGFMLFWLSTFEAILQHPKSWHLTLSWLVPLQRMLNNFQCSHYTASINPPSISLWHALHRTCKTYSCHKRKGTDAENGALVMEKKC